ncbi:UMP-CMP kinase 3-like isoform X2 [Citrus sinensis]|uniref:UMP-CMP kinase 3-like isoform X2 n=1 Tax=Citrus sinensis TaxID=2711 RepID=UPI00076379C6|nr:UMP-CMP kinase 3-like isoform X2 [Citrus sinensis]
MERVASDDTKKELVQNKDSGEVSSNQSKVVYVLGGPGSGKSTQCSKIAKHLGFRHLSAGDLLEAEAESGSNDGKMIREYKKEGKLVPSEIIVKLLQKAMQESQKKDFVIDGFPRNEENLSAAENILKIEPDAVLVFDCSEEEMTRRILSRNQIDAGRPIEEVFDEIKGVFSELNAGQDLGRKEINI